ncbi:hypothetical protein [Actinoplanes sp. NPDC026623]|uniref:hypothetical protein n=1 Tax=Actinoplanes sp. NPDC026623 TaxID=3155610 RepID=UPI0033F794B2
MNILFLALGASRKRAVVEECAKVVADGGTATVMVESIAPWQRAGFATGVTVIDSASLQRAQLPLRIERLVVYRGPEFLLRKVLGRRGKRAAGAYKKKVADRFHRRVFMPAYQRLRGDTRSALVAQHITRSPRPFDWIVIADPVSMPEAAQVMDTLGTGSRVGLAYSVDHIS